MLITQAAEKKKQNNVKTPDHHTSNVAMYRNKFMKWLRHKNIEKQMPDCECRLPKPVFIGTNKTDIEEVRAFENEFCLTNYKQKEKEVVVHKEAAAKEAEDEEAEDEEAVLLEIRSWKPCLWKQSDYIDCDYKQVKKGRVYIVFECFWDYDPEEPKLDELDVLLEDEDYCGEKLLEFINNNIDVMEALDIIKPKSILKKKQFYERIQWSKLSAKAGK